MTKRVCIFVDGENFRHSLDELFDDYDQRDYLPKTAQWMQFFDWLVAEHRTPAERVRTYWYVIERIDFWPYSFSRYARRNASSQDIEKARRIFSNDRDAKRELDGLTGEPLKAKVISIAEKLQQRQRTMSDRATGWRAIQDAIAHKHRSIEFRRAGAIHYDLFRRKLGSEKAVDVKLAIDLLSLREIYDIALIVSGDQDYVPAVEAVKDAGKHVVNVAFKMRNGRLSPGGARRLNQVTDASFAVPHNDLKRLMNYSR